MAEGRSSILVLHPNSTDPTSFLQPSTSESAPATTTPNASSPVEGFSGRGNDGDAKQGESSTTGSTSYTSANVPWEIENKYYTASVTFTAYPQEIFEMKEAEGVDVVMYIFEGSVNSLPPGLVKVMATPRDIALAVRIRGNTNEAREVIDELDGEKMEDLFDELGMEYMDESSLPEDDDERQERIRQTLMTHMWPNMVRKPIQSRMDMGFEDDDEDYNEEIHDVGDVPRSDFPVTFNPLQPQPRASTNDLNESANPDDFPGLDELRSQIMLEDLDKLHQGDELAIRRDMMGVFDGFGENENIGDWLEGDYARLDDWLEEDEDGAGIGDGDRLPAQRPTVEYDEELERVQLQQLQEELAKGPEGTELEESQFEDDFADFAPFQSGPSTGPGEHGEAGGIDPTPLLLHLQNVREELAGLDEDTRRERAGKEVESVLMSLGLGGLGGSDWEDEI